MNEKLKNFPSVRYVSLKESEARRADLIAQFEKYGITNHKMIEAIDGRVENFAQGHPKVSGEFVHTLESEVLAAGMSHLKAIHDWYTTTDEEMGFFCEDDIKFDMVDYWNFTWEEYLENVPQDWKILQLSLIRIQRMTQWDMVPHRKKWDDWSCCAYVLRREYAKEILDYYYDGDQFTLTIPKTNHHPLPENLVYPGNYLRCYTFPLFTENRRHLSTLVRKDSYEHHDNVQTAACNYIINWWETTGNNMTIKEIFSMVRKIPVIGAAVVNNPYWVSRLIMSVDYPVENFVIINNNGRGQIDEELDRLTKITHKFIDKIKVVHMPANIGCSGAWNLIIKCYMMAPYWIIVNDDVAFNPGLLKEMSDIVENNQHVGMIHPNAGDFNIGAWDLFLIRDHVVQQFGLFDENCYPAYCEDADYIMRLAHRPILKVIGTERSYQHGNADSKEYYKNGSQTEKSEDGLKQKLDKANDLNIEYLTKKWGPGWRMMNPNTLPFAEEIERNIGETRYDLEFVRSKHLGF